MTTEAASSALANWQPPHPGSREMPRWTAGDLIEPPRVTWKTWAAMIGPGIVAGGSAIGGGEWLLGPEVTARYGGAVMWLATLSILGQVLYNIEICRYTLYCGEPIFTGKFRTLPGPRFWLFTYLLLDFGSIFPYLAANAATPLATMILGAVPDPEHVARDWWLMKGLAYAIFISCLVPLLIGGKIYDSLRALMTFKIALLLVFLLTLGIFYSRPQTWTNVFSGFIKFGSVPVRAQSDINGDGRIDAADQQGEVDNLFLALWQGRPLPTLDLSMIATLAAFAAIAGNGGLSNAPISNYTRDQGWGMGWHVGAIPSVFGGHKLQLSHVGTVFPPIELYRQRWRGWVRHLVRDQVCIWMPACFIGLALPSMLSVEFLPLGTTADKWTAAALTAGGVRDRVTAINGAAIGQLFWYLTLFCGFITLGTTMVTTADGVVRRWVDVLWTASGRLRELEPAAIRRVYFFVLLGWAAFGLVALAMNPKSLVETATQFWNMALGFSCWHTVYINSTLLPPELRPTLIARVALVLAGAFFTTLTCITLLHKLGYIGT